jgi:hypothetical protein
MGKAGIRYADLIKCVKWELTPEREDVMSAQRNLTERTVVMLAPEQVERIDDWRFATRKRSESAAIRELIDLGLQAAARGEAQAA